MREAIRFEQYGTPLLGGGAGIVGVSDRPHGRGTAGAPGLWDWTQISKQKSKRGNKKSRSQQCARRERPRGCRAAEKRDEARGGGGLGQVAMAMTVTAKNFTKELSTGGFMPPFQPKPRQPSMSKAELRAQGQQALAQASKPVTKLPMKIKRQCGRCDHFNSVLVEPGEAVPAFKCSACGYSTARP